MYLGHVKRNTRSTSIIIRNAEIEITKITREETPTEKKKGIPLILLRYLCLLKCQCLLFLERGVKERGQDLLSTTTEGTKIITKANFGTHFRGYQE